MRRPNRGAGKEGRPSRLRLLVRTRCDAPSTRPFGRMYPSLFGISSVQGGAERSGGPEGAAPVRPSRSEEHTSELQSLMRISYAVFCLTKTKSKRTEHTTEQINQSTSTKTKTQ